jgi:hypothetical protein
MSGLAIALVVAGCAPFSVTLLAFVGFSAGLGWVGPTVRMRGGDRWGRLSQGHWPGLELPASAHLPKNTEERRSSHDAQLRISARRPGLLDTS